MKMLFSHLKTSRHETAAVSGIAETTPFTHLNFMKTILLIFLLASVSLYAQTPTPTLNAPELTAEDTPAGTIKFVKEDLENILTIYGRYVNRTILRPQTLPTPQITLINQTPLSRREVIQALDAVLSLNGISMINIGEKFVKVVPSSSAAVEAAPFGTNDSTTLPDLGQYVTHIVQLKVVRPSEMIAAIQPFAKIPGGILPIDSSGILVLRDNTENVKRMLEMIKQIDVAVESDFISEVIPIKYALASEISSALNALGGTTSGSVGGGGGGGLGAGARTGTGINRAGGGLTRPGATPNTPQAIPAPGAVPGAPSYTERLQNIIRRASSPGGAGDFQVLGTTKIIADERTNSLLVFASRADMAMIKDVINKLDVVLAQVLIEAIIMEVTLDDGRTLGVSASQSPKQFSPNFTGVGGVNNGQPFFPFGGGGSNSFPGGFTSVLPGGAGQAFSYFGRLGNDYDVAVQAAATDSRVNVLSRPRIQTSHGVQAELFVGQTVPYIQGTSFGDFAGVSSRSSYQEKQIGITLTVKPLINPDGLVVMEIVQDIGQRGADIIIDGNPVPIINQRRANATVAVKNHETIILGGFISNTKTKSKSGVPWLMDIPLLGNLFRSTSDGNSRVELIVLLRPTVLPTPEIAAATAMVEKDKMPGVRRAEIQDNEAEAKKIKQLNRYMDRKDIPRADMTPGRDSAGFLAKPANPEGRDNEGFLAAPAKPEGRDNEGFLTTPANPEQPVELPAP